MNVLSGTWKEDSRNYYFLSMKIVFNWNILIDVNMTTIIDCAIIKYTLWDIILVHLWCSIAMVTYCVLVHNINFELYLKDVLHLILDEAVEFIVILIFLLIKKAVKINYFPVKYCSETTCLLEWLTIFLFSTYNFIGCIRVFDHLKNLAFVPTKSFLYHETW